MKLLSDYLTLFGGEPAHWCPGCEELHRFSISKPLPNGSQWSFDGNLEKPTFQPSMNIGHGGCHYFLHAGVLKYQRDCEHELAGKEIPLPPLPTWARR